MAYASGTQVSIDKSIAEIESTLDRFGADRFAYMKDRKAGEGRVQFTFGNLNVQMKVTLPDRDDEQFTKTPGRGNIRTPKAAFE